MPFSTHVIGRGTLRRIISLDKIILIQKWNLRNIVVSETYVSLNLCVVQLLRLESGDNKDNSIYILVQF